MIIIIVIIIITTTNNTSSNKNNNYNYNNKTIFFSAISDLWPYEWAITFNDASISYIEFDVIWYYLICKYARQPYAVSTVLRKSISALSCQALHYIWKYFIISVPYLLYVVWLYIFVYRLAGPAKSWNAYNY